MSDVRRCFFDTCILLYALVEIDHRTAIAEQLLADGGGISVQILNEFAVVARRKFRLSYEQITGLSRASADLCGEPRPLTLDTHKAALGIAQRYGFHFYDCLIIASALEAGCRTLYTEDLQHNQQIDTLTVVNPFLATPTH